MFVFFPSLHEMWTLWESSGAGFLRGSELLQQVYVELHAAHQRSLLVRSQQLGVHVLVGLQRLLVLGAVFKRRGEQFKGEYSECQRQWKHSQCCRTVLVQGGRSEMVESHNTFFFPYQEVATQFFSTTVKFIPQQ